MEAGNDVLAGIKRWDFVPLGLGLGLYLSRAMAEMNMAVWPWWALLALAVGCVALGVGLIVLGRRGDLDLTPIAVLYAYVLYPRLNPSLALAVGLLAAAATILANLRIRFAIEPIVFAASLALYFHTLAPTVLPADSGEFQLVSRLLGIAHPPGYPLYTMLGKLFTLVPIGDAAYRLNLMSALFAALTLALVCRIVSLATGSPFGGLVAAIALGAAPTFWAQATTANIRSLTALFAALSLFALVSYARTRRSVCLTLFGLAFGLGITHHGSLAFLALPFLAFLLVTDLSLFTEFRPLLKPLLAFL
ncbi:MAG: DUF2723 domain-containing protein, partial [Chloroflexota bacterium]|nr:DUF2723 domain-containing protein [Chloroflexota bacterium]